MKIINLFCDASINIDRKVACGGCLITLQDMDTMELADLGIRGYLQKDATNNSGEILAIWTAIVEAIRLKAVYPDAIFRLFSDSKISLYGLRDWIKNWIRMMRPNGTLISSSGKPVVNQQRFIDCFNLVVENDMHIELYHQRGHVEDGRVSPERARIGFIRANKVPPESLGITMEYLCRCNDIIDNYTRDAIATALLQNNLSDGIYWIGEDPMVFKIRSNMLHQYITCINKTSVKSHHDFKGGYNQ